MVDVLSREPDKKFLINLDQRQVTHQVRDQSGRTLTNVKVEFVENHFPRALLLEFLRLTDEVQQNELLELDRA